MSSNNSTLPEETFQKYVSIIVPSLFAVVVLVGVVGNLLVIIVVLSNKKMRSTTNILIMSLAITDLSFLVFCVPFTAVSYTVTQWPFGDVWCKILYYLIYVFAYGSVYTLVLMSFDRYLAVVHAIRSMTIRNERNTFIALALMWSIILLGNINLLFDYNVLKYKYMDANRSTCYYGVNNTRLFYTTFFVMGYGFPFSLICVLYGFMLKRLLYGIVPGGGSQSAESTRSKKRVTKMVVIVVTIFAICWFPNQTTLIIDAYHTELPTYFYIVQIAANCFAYMNSCMNPILYAFLSDNFRKSFKRILCCYKYSSAKPDNYERTHIPDAKAIGMETLNNTKLSNRSNKSKRLSGQTNGNEITTLINNDLNTTVSFMATTNL